MHEQYRIHSDDEQALTAVDREVASQLVKRLDQFLAPRLLVLDAYLDSRLVRTLVDLLVSLVQLRHREAGVEFARMGSHAAFPPTRASGKQAHQPLVPELERGFLARYEQFLWRRAKLHLEALEQRGETALILHDGSEMEQPESVRVEGLCPVRSAKGRRLSRPRASSPLCQPNGWGSHPRARHPLARSRLDRTHRPARSGKDALLD